MSKDQAARQAPIPPPQFIREAFSLDEDKIKPGEQRDKMIADFAGSDMWKHLKGVIQRYQKQIAVEMRETANESDSMAEIGAMFMVTDKVNQFANRLITHIDRVPEVMKKAQEEKDKKSD